MEALGVLMEIPIEFRLFEVYHAKPGYTKVRKYFLNNAWNTHWKSLFSLLNLYDDE